MPEEALSMRKIREVLRLSALGLKQHQIAGSCSIVQSTVHKYLKLAEAAQLRWPLPEDLSEHKLDELLFGQRPEPPSRRLYPPPDFAAVRPTGPGTAPSSVRRVADAVVGNPGVFEDLPFPGAFVRGVGRDRGAAARS